jgi:hypothetical protein
LRAGDTLPDRARNRLSASSTPMTPPGNCSSYDMGSACSPKITAARAGSTLRESNRETA